MPRRFEIGDNAVSLRIITPGRASAVLAEHAHIQEQLASEAEEMAERQHAHEEAMEPLRAALKRIEDGTLTGEAAKAAERSILDRYKAAQSEFVAGRARVTRRADIARGCLLAAVVASPSLPARKDDELVQPYYVRCVEHLQDAHGWEEPEIGALVDLAAKHLEVCTRPARDLVDAVEVRDLAGRAREVDRLVSVPVPHLDLGGDGREEGLTPLLGPAFPAAELLLAEPELLADELLPPAREGQERADVSPDAVHQSTSTSWTRCGLMRPTSRSRAASPGVTRPSSGKAAASCAGVIAG